MRRWKRSRGETAPAHPIPAADGASGDDGVLTVLSSAVLAAVLVALAVFILAAPMPRILAIVPDDAAYYFKIAENASAGSGFTFDGINRTNGFQPLWLAVLVPIYAAYHGPPETMFRIFLILQLALLAAAALLVRALLRRFYPPHVVLFGGLLFLFTVIVPAVNGMESAILVFALSLLLYAAFAWEIGVRGGVGRHIVFGFLLGLVILARLDTVFLAIMIGVVWLVRVATRHEREERFLPELLGVVIGAVVLVAPYLAWNVMSFGAVMPISGALKSSFPMISPPGAGLSHLGKRGLAGLVLAVCYLIWLAARRRAKESAALGGLFRGNRAVDTSPERTLRAGGHAHVTPERTRFREALAVAAAAVVLHALHTLFFMRWAVFSWHFIPYAFLGSLIVCEPLSRIPALRGWAVRTVYFLAVGAVLGRGVYGIVSAFRRPLDRTWSTAAYEAALWARATTAPDAIFAMKDAGNFGYFSERSTVNLDGVVNNHAYQRALRDKDLGGYLARSGAGYIVQHAFWDRPDMLSGSYDEYGMSYRSHLYGTESDTITVRRSDEAYRSRPYFDGPYETVFLVWRLRSAER